MREYVRLTMSAEAYWSGSTYNEERFIPIEAWEKIKEDFPGYSYIHELDGKHSETKAEIENEVFTEEELKSYVFNDNDGPRLLEMIEEHFGSDEDVIEIDEEIRKISQMEVLTIKFNTKIKDKLLKVFKENGIEVL